jgi:glycosyltransferase 2 family protein
MPKITTSLVLKFAAVALFLVIAYSSDLLQTVRNGFEFRFLWAAIAIQPIIMLAYLALAVRHVQLIRQPVPVLTAYKSMVLAQGLNLILPGRLSELIKGTYIRDHAGVQLSIGMAAVVLERTIDIIILAGLGALGLILFASALDYRAVVVLVILAAVVLGVAFFARALVLRLIRLMPWPGLVGFFEKSYLHLFATVRTAAFPKAFAWGLVGWGISYCGILLFLFLATDYQLSFGGTLLLFIFTTVGAAVPLVPGSLGVYEAAGVLALRTVGYEFGEALALVISLHAAQLVFPFTIAWLILLTERVGLSRFIADLRRSVRQ